MKLFRSIRQNLMETDKTSRYLKYAIGEIILVVIGILIALQINNWNEFRKESKQEQLILKKLNIELQNDIQSVKQQITIGTFLTDNYKFCLDVLSSQKEADLEEFNQYFSSSTVMTSFDMNKTTFNAITESRSIDFIQNKQLVDSLNAFYNSDYKSWDTASLTYTRNVIVPYLIQFDYLPIVNYEKIELNSSGFISGDFSSYDLSKFEVKPKTIADFKKNIFIINVLRQRLFLTEGQIKHYQRLKLKIERLVAQIQEEIKTE